MHERKVQMALRSAGFVGLPGGFGTFEEVMIHRLPLSVISWLFFLSSRYWRSPPGHNLASTTSVSLNIAKLWYTHFILLAVVLLNVLSFWDPLRILIKSSVEAGFIKPSSERLIVFVDGPADKSEHEYHNWGKAALGALDSWQRGHNSGLFKWDIGGKHEVDFKETYT